MAMSTIEKISPQKEVVVTEFMKEFADTAMVNRSGQICKKIYRTLFLKNAKWYYKVHSSSS